eukprot:1161175-Pelagomonas_calceolata.AAC.5
MDIKRTPLAFLCRYYDRVAAQEALIMQVNPLDANQHPLALLCRYYDRVAAQEALIERRLNEEKEEEEEDEDEVTPEQIWMVGCRLHSSVQDHKCRSRQGCRTADTPKPRHMLTWTGLMFCRNIGSLAHA